jgi:Family of unknown function (DUF6529)
VEDLVESLTRGNVTEVKVVLASVVAALAVYQLVLIAVGYGRIRPRFLDAGPATAAHRFAGDAIAVIIVVVAVMCVSYFGFEDDDLIHVVAGSALLAVIALKIAVVRRGGSLGRFLPVLGLTVFALIAVTWLSSAGSFLAVR